MGILLMNIAAFALPQAAYVNPLADRGAGAADLAVWAIMFALVDGKMRAIFSILFGAGIVLLLRRAEEVGQDGASIHFRRMGALLAIGVLHFFLIWWGDILVLYALIGGVAWFFAERSSRTLLRLAAGLIAVQAVVYAVMLGLIVSLADQADDAAASAAAVAQWREIVGGFGLPDAEWIARETARYRGGYADIVAYRWQEMRMLPLQQVFFAGAETLAFMLIGMALVKRGFITGAAPRATYLRTALLCYAIGLPAEALLAAVPLVRGFDPATMFGVTILGGTPLRPIIALGHVALLLSWMTGGESPMRRRMAAAGRLALSNYLATSMAMTLLFYGYGLGLFGRLGRPELLVVVATAWLAMLGWSKPWADRFALGPAEWVWRSLADLKFRALRRNEVIAS